ARTDGQVPAGRGRGARRRPGRDRLVGRPASRLARGEPLMRLGLDLIEIARVRRALERHGNDFRDRCFTPAEQAYCEGRATPAQHYAGRFAAKEAVGKALGTGVHFTWKEIEISGRPKPGVFLSGRTARWAAERIGEVHIELSMTHSRELAAAVAVVIDAP